jgi:hypothetical protein
MRQSDIGLMRPSGKLGSPVTYPIISEFPTHEIPVGNAVDFKSNIGRKLVFVDGHPMPNPSFPHVTLLIFATP